MCKYRIKSAPFWHLSFQEPQASPVTTKEHLWINHDLDDWETPQTPSGTVLTKLSTISLGFIAGLLYRVLVYSFLFIQYPRRVWECMLIYGCISLIHNQTRQPLCKTNMQPIIMLLVFFLLNWKHVIKYYVKVCLNLTEINIFWFWPTFLSHNLMRTFWLN